MSNNFDNNLYNPEGSILRQSQLAALDILIEFDRICKRHQLVYFLEFGTLLGAIRHNGFIPWDDDIDVSMPKEDFIFFQEIAEKEICPTYFIQTEKKEPESGMGHGMFKIRKNNTIWINDFDDFRRNYHKGISIDVFELESYPKVSKKITKFFMKRLSKSFGFYHYFPRVSFKNCVAYFVFKPSWIIFYPLWKLLCILLPSDYIQPHIERLSFSNPSKEDVYFPPKTIYFEGYPFYGPNNPDIRLSDIFGDYHKLPPEKDRKCHYKYVNLF